MVRIHQRVHERHPELDDGDVEAAWESYCFAAVRIPGEREMRTGYDPQGQYIERAAAACGMRKSEFLRSAAIEKAERILRSA